MRASLDASMGGGAGGGFSQALSYGLMGGGGAGGMGGGMSDFGTQIRPVTFTPPAIAMQPHFGMFQVQQTLTQAGLSAMGGPAGVGLSGAMTNFRTGGLSGLINGPGAVPNNITMSEYMAMSARGFGDRLGDAAAISGLTVLSTGVGLAGGGAGATAGSALFTGVMGKALGGLVGGALGGMAVSAYTGAVTDMMAENRANQSALAAGSFRFFNGPSGEVDRLTGRGMSRATRVNAATSIQNMELGDTRYGTSEYSQILEGGMQMDMFSGTRDVEDFKTKFKGLVENLKTVTSTLHTSLKEGIEVIRGFRDMGVTDPSEINRLTLGSEARGRSSGRTGMEMMAIGQTGAEMFRGTGIDMQRGFELNQMNVGTVRNLLTQGGITREAVAQAGGENALAQQMTAGALASMQTSYGRAALMANYNAGTNSLNPNMVHNMAGGDIFNQISGAAGMGPGALLKFQAHQEELISKMSPEQMQVFGIASDAGMARSLMQAAPGLDFESAFRVAGQRAGKSRSQIDVEIGMLNQDPEKMRQQQQVALQAVQSQAGLEDLRNRFNVGKRISNALRGEFVEPVADTFTQMSATIGERVEDFYLKITGQANANMTGASSETLKRGAALLKSGEYSGETLDTRSAGLLGDAFGYGQSGKALLSDIVGSGGSFDASGSMQYKGSTVRTFANAEEATAAGKSGGTAFTILGSGGKGVIAVSTDSLTSMMTFSRDHQSTKEQREVAAKGKLDPKTAETLVSLGSEASLATVVDALAHSKKGNIGKDFASMHEEEFDKKYGKGKMGAIAAKTERYMAAYDVNTSAHRELIRIQTGESVSDNAANARAQLMGKVNLNKEKLLAGYAGESGFLGGRAYAALKGDDESLRIISDPNLTEAQREVALLDRRGAGQLSGLSGADIHKITSHEASIAPAGSERAKENAKLNKSIAAMTSVANNLAGGGETVNNSKVMGDVSKDTAESVKSQTEQLNNMYKVIIDLQTQLLHYFQASGRKK